MAEAESSNRSASQHMEAAELALAECLEKLDKALNNSHECGESLWYDLW